MANDLNQCNFIGRLGNDPEVRYQPSGQAVANLSIAVGSKWRDKNSGEPRESTEWVRLVAFGKQAEIIGEYLSKGSQIFVSAKCRTRKWQDQSGVERYSTEFVIDNLQMLGSRPENHQHGGNQMPVPKQNQGYAPKPQQQPQQQNYTPDLDDGWDSDIPF